MITLLLIRLVNELSTNTAKVCALCFSASDQMCSSSSDFFNVFHANVLSILHVIFLWEQVKRD